MSLDRFASVGSTLAGGVQDVAALLPLIGTEQCETHVGSALEGGYLYAAATPLSIFGSLGIVKAGVSILFSSVSISVPKITLSFHKFKPTITYSPHRKWLGARILRDAGFKLTGVVAPLIGMDGQRHKAETRLVEMLEKKHIDDPNEISIDWISGRWSIMLTITTFVSALLSFTPYIVLLPIGPQSWKSVGVHLPWIFPALRIWGSCTATVACQFIIQSRVISLMKNRIIFMIIDRRLNNMRKGGLDAWLEDVNLQWDSKLPAEQCLWNLEKVLLSIGRRARPTENLTETKKDAVIEKDSASQYTRSAHSKYRGHTSIPMSPLSPESALAPEPIGFDIDDLRPLQQEHFPNSSRDTAFIVFSWILLLLALPATVTGYIGCFTLVSALSAKGNGPLVWVGIEGALSILRIFIWASNPHFDEETEITLSLKLTDHQPVFTTDNYDPDLTKLKFEERKSFTLVSEREFLGGITPFTGPLDQFQKTDNLTMYFTLSYDYGVGGVQGDEVSKLADEISMESPAYGRLFVTVFDVNMQVGVTFGSYNGNFFYFDVVVKYDTPSRKWQADIRSEKRDAHPWRIEDNNLFVSLQKYYQYIVNALNRRDIINRYIPVAKLHWKWDMSQKSGLTKHEARRNDGFQNTNLQLLTTGNQLYLERCYEHHLKTELVTIWSQWIVQDMDGLQSRARRNDCHQALKDPTSEKAKQELTELDAELVWEWARRELVLLVLSSELENVLRAKMDQCISEVDGTRTNRQMMMWMGLEFQSGQRKRIDEEREAAKKRMEKAMKDASERADRDGRSWQEDTEYLAPLWIQAIKFIDKKWSAAINNEWEELRGAEDELEQMMLRVEEGGGLDDGFVEALKKQVLHDQWHFQHQLEEQMMVVTIQRIRAVPGESTRKELDRAYRYPQADTQAIVKFAELRDSSSKGKACSAAVYDARYCNREAVCRVVAKRTTRSVINVRPDIIASIPPNDYVLFLACEAGKGKEPAFVQQNRDRWWEQQTTNSSTFYFTPMGVSDDSCYSYREAIAHIFIFLTAPTVVRVSVLHCGHKAINVTIREDAEELASISNIPRPFQFHDFQPFMLQAGRHELEVVPQVHPFALFNLLFNYYSLKEILIEFLDVPRITTNETDSGGLGVMSILNLDRTNEAKELHS